MIIISSSYDPTSVTTGHAATAASVGLRLRSWATLAASIAVQLAVITIKDVADWSASTLLT